MISQKINVISSFNYNFLLTNIIWCVSDERKLFFSFRFESEGGLSGGRSSQERFNFFLLGLDDSAIFKLCLENFSKDLNLSKNVV